MVLPYSTVYTNHYHNVHLTTGNDETINPAVRQNFMPVEGSKPCLENIFHAMYSSSEDACAFEYIDIPAPASQRVASELNVGVEVEVDTSHLLPPTLESMLLENDIKSHKDIPMLLPDEITALNSSTTAQFKSDLWKSHRVARITASNIHSIKTRMNTVNKKPDIEHDVTPTINKICAVNQEIHTESVTYGIVHEDEAIAAFKKKLKKDGHRNVNIKPCGLIVHPKHPYVAASPDGIVTCDCCEDRVLEVKCPLRCIGKDPNSTTLPCLTNTSGKPRLKTTHEYYDQIITQMAVAQTKCGEFVIYSRKGIYQQRIVYNHVAFMALIRACQQFFDTYITAHYHSKRALVKAMAVQHMDGIDAEAVTHQQDMRADDMKTSETIVNRDMPSNEQVYAAIDNQDYGLSMNVIGEVEIETSASTFSLLTANTNQKRARRKRRIIAEAPPIYICNVCKTECLQVHDVSAQYDYSVQCDDCKQWYHQICVSYKQEDIWVCQECTAEIMVI